MIDQAPKGSHPNTYSMPIWVGWVGAAMLAVGVLALGLDLMGRFEFFGVIGRIVNVVLDMVLILIGVIFVRSVWAR